MDWRLRQKRGAGATAASRISGAAVFLPREAITTPPPACTGEGLHMASTEFPEESRRSSHSSIDLYSTSAKAILQFVSDRKCAVDSRPRIDRFCLAQGRVITPEQEGGPETPRAQRE